MSRWHRATCRRPDVYFAGGVPFCSACDASADCHSVEPDSSPGIPLAPELPTDGIRNLSWPPSVEYQQDEDDDQISDQNLRPTSEPTRSSPAVPAVAPSSSQELYAPLEQTNHVRLLRLSKGSFDDPIHGTLITSSLDDGGVDFEALSYAWADETGDDSRRKIIFLGPFWNVFKVTANCFAALRRMRKAKKDVMIWVDAICIDQGNHAERNHQVGLMAKIYSSARELFVYLGEGDKELEAALIRLTWFNEAKLIDPRVMRRLFQCRYFSRMWIIQEVANAKMATIHYGANSIRWAALSEERLLSIFGRNIVQSIPRWITTIYNQPQHTVSDLARLLLNTASSEAADPRDHVFALFGLLENAASHALVADYALPVPMVSTGIAAFVILNLGHRWTLDFAIGNNTQQLPTWVPDWQAVRRGPKLVNNSSAGSSEEDASPDSEVDGLPVPGFPGLNTNLGGRISNSGCLTILAATLMNANDFPLHWALSIQIPPLSCDRGEFQFSVAGILGVPPGKVVIFPQTHSLFFLETDSTLPSRYKIRGTCQILLSQPQSLESQDNSKRPWDSETPFAALDALRSFCDRRLKKENIAWLAELDQRISKHLGLERQTDGFDSRPWNPDSFTTEDVWVLVHMYADRDLATTMSSFRDLLSDLGKTHMMPLLTSLRLFETEAFWRDVTTAAEIERRCSDWLELMFDVSKSLGIEYVKRQENPMDPTRQQLLARWAAATCALVRRLAPQATNKFYQDARLRVRVGEVVLVFFPTDELSEQSMAGMEQEELETLVRSTLDYRRGLPQFPTKARTSIDDDGASVWDYGPCTSFMQSLTSGEDEDRRDTLKSTFSMCAFLRTLLPQRRTWEEVRVY